VDLARPGAGGTAYGGLGVQPPIGDSLGGGALRGATIATVEGGAARSSPLPHLSFEKHPAPFRAGGPGGRPTGGFTRQQAGRGVVTLKGNPSGATPRPTCRRRAGPRPGPKPAQSRPKSDGQSDGINPGINPSDLGRVGGAFVWPEKQGGRHGAAYLRVAGCGGRLTLGGLIKPQKVVNPTCDDGSGAGAVVFAGRKFCRRGFYSGLPAAGRSSIGEIFLSEFPNRICRRVGAGLKACRVLSVGPGAKLPTHNAQLTGPKRRQGRGGQLGRRRLRAAAWPTGASSAMPGVWWSWRRCPLGLSTSHISPALGALPAPALAAPGFVPLAQFEKLYKKAGADTKPESCSPHNVAV